jgi:hypothetical protein
LPPTARDLDLVLGMTAQRVVFHYGIELEGLKYNGPELGELRRRIVSGTKVELTFDPGDLGHINVLDSQKGAYIPVPAVDQAYATGLSLWQHKVIRRYALRQLSARTDIVALARAKAEIRALVERDFDRKSTHGRRRHARFLEDHTWKPAISAQPTVEVNLSHAICMVEDAPAQAKPALPPEPTHIDTFSDDGVLPVFEASLDLPRVPVELVQPVEMRKE